MRYLCTGRVQPERADISFGRVDLHLADGGRAVASCDSSQVTVLVEHPDLDGWVAGMILAENVAEIVVGALGFSLGSGYSVDMVQIIEEDGTPHIFGVRPTGEAPRTSLGIEPHTPAFNRAFRLSGRDVFFRLALQDYLRAIVEVTDCATYCYRAIEGIKSAFVHKTGMDRWDDMHSALGTGRQEITVTIKDFADPVRHGNWVALRPTDSRQRWEMLCLTRDILIKYLDLNEPDA